MPIFLASSSNRSMNVLPMIFRFCSGSSDALETSEKRIRSVHNTQVDMEVFPECPFNLFRLASAHQPVVDVDAGELVADRPVYQDCRHRRIDAARSARRRPGGSPTWSRIRTTDSLMNDSGVQSP